MGRMVSLFFITLLCLRLSVVTFLPACCVEQKLVRMGIPHSIISNMPEHAKANMAKCYDELETFGGTKAQIFVLKDGKIKIATGGIISSKKLKRQVNYVILQKETEERAPTKYVEILLSKNS